jgi:diguanylate cyclase (GGDEF)-like protein
MRESRQAAAKNADRRAVGDAVLVLSGDGTICSLLRKPDGVSNDLATELPGSPIERLWPDEVAAMVRDNIKRTLRSRQVVSVDFEGSGEGVHYDFIFVIQGRDRVLLVVRNVSAQKTAISRMKQLAYVDDVTGLPNREYLLEELSKITEGLRLKGGRAVVICFDIEQPVSGTGASARNKHEAVLKTLAMRLTHGLRSANRPDIDDAKRYSIVARVDSRQFAVVLPSIETGTDAADVTGRLSESLRQPFKTGKREVKVGVSAGIALFPQDGTDAQTLLDNATAAMEDAKSNHSVEHKFHSGTVKVRALKRQDLELELKTALDREEFHLNYLPIVHSGTRKVVTAEALLRWPQAVFGARPIRQVITLAEHTGLIVPIGEWVLRNSCEQLHAWHESGHPHLRLAVNLSVQEFSRSDLVPRVAGILDDNSIDPQHVDFEITEHVLFRDAMKDFAKCRELKDLGVRVVVDDYGTGACSLEHFSRSPVDGIKIDCSFVQQAETSRSDRSVCAAATALARALDLKVVAEGVETEAQATLLQELGCDFLQGFLFCKPSSASDFSDYLGNGDAASE